MQLYKLCLAIDTTLKHHTARTVILKEPADIPSLAAFYQ